MNRVTTRLSLLLVTIVWGSGYVVSDILLEHMSAFQLLTGRFGLTFLLLMLVYWKKIKTIKKTTIKRGAILGALLYAAFALQTVGLLFTTPSKNAFLTQMSVVFVPLISYFMLRRQAEIKTQIGIVVSIVGVGFMSLSGFGPVNIGDILSLLCAMFFALQFIFVEKYTKEEDTSSLMITQMGSASILSFIVNLFTDDFYLGGNATANMWLIYLALFGTLISYGIQTIAQRNVSASEASLVLSLESFWGMIFSVWILNEVISQREFIGAGLILLGVVISEMPTLSPKLLAQFVRTKKYATKTEE